MKKKASNPRWVSRVTTVSTFPPRGTFTKPAKEIARIMASPEVSPKGIGSGIRMVQYFINRAGRGLPPERRRELEKSKRILHKMLIKGKKGKEWHPSRRNKWSCKSQ